MESAIAADVTASALGFFLENSRTSRAGDGGRVAGDIKLRKLGIVMRVDGKINSTIDNVASAPGMRIGI